MRGSKYLLKAQVCSETDSKSLSSISVPNYFVRAILGGGDGDNPSNISV